MRIFSAFVTATMSSLRARARTVFVSASLVAVVGSSLLTAPFAAAAPSLADKQAQARALGVQVSALEDRYGTLQERFRGAQVELARLQKDVVRTQRKLAVARHDLDGAKVRLTDRAVAIYRDGDGSNELLVVAQAGSIQELFDRVDTIQRVGSQDARILNRVRSAAERVQKAEARLRATRDKQVVVVRRARADRQRMRRVLDKRKAALNSVNGEIRTIMYQQQAAAAAAAARSARITAANIDANGGVTPGRGNAAVAQAVTDQGTPAGVNDHVTTPAATAAPSEASAPEVPLPPASGTAASAASIAVDKSGSPYVYGAAGPSSFDCSGLVVWAFAQAGRPGLPHSTYALIGMGVSVPLSQAQVGDLVFTDGAGHMGIYVGGGSFVHAPRTGRTVTVESLSYYHVTAVRRI